MNDITNTITKSDSNEDQYLDLNSGCFGRKYIVAKNEDGRATLELLTVDHTVTLEPHVVVSGVTEVLDEIRTNEPTMLVALVRFICRNHIDVPVDYATS